MISVLSAENADATEHVCWCPQRPSRFFMFSPLGMVGAVSENEKRHPTSMNHYQSGDSFPYHPVWVWLECNDPDHWTPRQDGRIHTYVFWGFMLDTRRSSFWEWEGVLQWCGGVLQCWSVGDPETDPPHHQVIPMDISQRDELKSACLTGHKHRPPVRGHELVLGMIELTIFCTYS